MDPRSEYLTEVRVPQETPVGPEWVRFSFIRPAGLRRNTLGVDAGKIVPVVVRRMMSRMVRVLYVRELRLLVVRLDRSGQGRISWRKRGL